MTHLHVLQKVSGAFPWMQSPSSPNLLGVHDHYVWCGLFWHTMPIAVLMMVGEVQELPPPSNAALQNSMFSWECHLRSDFEMCQAQEPTKLCSSKSFHSSIICHFYEGCQWFRRALYISIVNCLRVSLAIVLGIQCSSIAVILKLKLLSDTRLLVNLFTLPQIMACIFHIWPRITNPLHKAQAVETSMPGD